MKYDYPSTFRRITATLAIGMLVLNGSEYLLEWLRAAYALAYKPLELPYLDFLQPFHPILPTLLTSHIGLFLALLVARAIAFLTPRITLDQDGLLTSSVFGARYIPFNAIRKVYSTELQPNGRYVVWIDSTKGLPLHGWLASLLFGRWLWRGFLLTSDLQHFDDVIATIASQLKRKYGETKFAAQFVEETPTWLLSMLNDPRATISQVVARDTLPIDQRTAIMQMISASASLALPAIVAGIIHIQVPWIALVIPLLALIEFPLASVYLSDLPMDTFRRMEFDDAIRIYPLTQLPRWWVAIGLTVLIIAGVPALILLLAPLAAIAVNSRAVVQLSEEWFHIKSPESWLGALVTVIYQLLLYEMLIVFLPR